MGKQIAVVATPKDCMKIVEYLQNRKAILLNKHGRMIEYNPSAEEFPEKSFYICYPHSMLSYGKYGPEFSYPLDEAHKLCFSADQGMDAVPKPIENYLFRHYESHVIEFIGGGMARIKELPSEQYYKPGTLYYSPGRIYLGTYDRDIYGVPQPQWLQDEYKALSAFIRKNASLKHHSPLARFITYVFPDAEEQARIQNCIFV